MLQAPHLGLLALLVGLAASACATAAADDAAETEGTSEEAIVGQGKRVCSWNVRRLGHDFDGKPKNIDAVQKVISANCDLIAVQEVMQKAGGSVPGYDALVAELGTTYWGSMRTAEPRPNTTSANSERYAWFWRKSAVSPCDGFGEPRYVSDAPDAFLREPAYACFKVKAHPRELVLGSYHALYGSEIERKREVGLLDDDLDGDGNADDVLRGFRAARPGADVMLVGDFNLTPPQLKAALPTYVDLTSGAGSTINSTDAISANQYDHVLLMPDEPLAALAPARTLDVRGVAPKGTSYFQTVSDHLPIQLILGSTANAQTR